MTQRGYLGHRIPRRPPWARNRINHITQARASLYVRAIQCHLLRVRERPILLRPARYLSRCGVVNQIRRTGDRWKQLLPGEKTIPLPLGISHGETRWSAANPRRISRVHRTKLRPVGRVS